MRFFCICWCPNCVFFHFLCMRVCDLCVTVAVSRIFLHMFCMPLYVFSLALHACVRAVCAILRAVARFLAWLCPNISRKQHEQTKNSHLGESLQQHHFSFSNTTAVGT